MFIIDFDDTLFDAGRFKELRRQAVARCGVSEADYWQTYEVLSARGYDNEVHARALAGRGYHYDSVLAALETTTSEKILKECVFSEAPEFLRSLKQFGQPLILFTFNPNVEFQKQKITASGLHDYFDETRIVSKKKIEALLDLGLTPESKGWLFDDKISLGAAVRENFPLVRPVLKWPIERDEADYKQSGLPYFSNLMAILEYVRKNS